MFEVIEEIEEGVYQVFGVTLGRIAATYGASAPLAYRLRLVKALLPPGWHVDKSQEDEEKMKPAATSPTKFVIVGYKAMCKWCDMAKEMLDGRGLPYDFYEAGGDVAQLMKSMNFHTVPRIWHGPTYVGGYDDLVVYLRDRPHL